MALNDILNDYDFIPQSKYYTTSEFNSTFNQTGPNNNLYRFSLLNINIRSLQKNFDNFEEFLFTLNTFPFSLIGITETWLHSTSPPIFNIDNYELIHTDRTNGKGGGVALYIRNDLQYKIRHDIQIEGIETLFLEIIDDKYKNKIVGVIYRPPNNVADTFLDKLESCLEFVSRENKDIYIMGDFNIDLSLPYTVLGQHFINLLSSFSFKSLIDKPTRITNVTHTIIDNIFSNVIDNEQNGIIYYDISDHLPIFTICPNNKHVLKTPNKEHLTRRKETHCNVESLKRDLSQENWNDIYFERDVNSSYEKFINKLLCLYDKNIPLTRIKLSKKRNKQPWITQGIIKSISTRTRLYKISLRLPTNENQNKYKKYRNKLTSIIRLSRKLYYSNKIENSKDNNKLLWQTINDILGKKRSTLNNIEFKDNGHPIQDPIDVANAFNKYFNNIGPDLASKIINKKDDFLIYLNDNVNQSLFFNPTNIHEILEIVRSLKCSKSSGYDELSVFLLKQIIHFIASPLLHIFNLSLSQGIFPDPLKIAKIIPIYKKDDQSNIANYRPISLLPSISKILEKIAYKRLYSFLNMNNLLIPNQYGFRKNHSTDYAILQLSDKIIDSIAKKEHTVGVFMDLSKAFDTMDHCILIRKLKTYGVRGTVLSWFEDYLRNRQQYVIFKSKKSNISTVKCGVPQGSILGPLLFLIYMNDIVNASPLLTYVLFADDTNVFYSHTDLNILITTLNLELNKLSSWFKSNKLSLNINKTNCMYFKNIHSKYAPYFNILIDDMPIIEKEVTTFLGVMIDSNLTWNSHINNICMLVSRGIGILYKLKYCLSQKSLFMLYNSLILSHISYCNIVWGNSNKMKIMLIYRLQKKALRICTHSYYIAHTDPIFYELKTLQIADIHIFQTAIFMYKFWINTIPLAFRNIFVYNSSIHSYPTRHSSDFHLTNPKIIMAYKSIRHHGPDIWNALPDKIKHSASLYSFKASMKKYLISKYS